MIDLSLLILVNSFKITRSYIFNITWKAKYKAKICSANYDWFILCDAEGQILLLSNYSNV